MEERGFASNIDPRPALARISFHLALNHPIFTRRIPAIGINIPAMPEEPKAPAQHRPIKPDMVSLMPQIQDNQEQIHRHINHHVPIKSEPGLHPRLGPPICDLVHAFISASLRHNDEPENFFDNQRSNLRLGFIIPPSWPENDRPSVEQIHADLITK